MQKTETLAQLICRTVLEFERRQASLQQDIRENSSISASTINDTSNQTISNQKSA